MIDTNGSDTNDKKGPLSKVASLLGGDKKKDSSIDETTSSVEKNLDETNQEATIFDAQEMKVTDTSTTTTLSEPSKPKEPPISAVVSLSDKPSPQLPASQLVLPVIPLRDSVLFPHTESVLTFGRDVSVNGLRAAMRSGNMAIIISQRDPDLDSPKPQHLYQVGTLVHIDRTLKTEKQINALVHGTQRVKVLRYLRTSPYLLAQVARIEESWSSDEELTALSSHLQKEFRRSIQMGKPVEFLNFMKLMSGVDESQLTDQIASTLEIATSDKQAILETIDVKDRVKKVVKELSREIKVLEIEKDVAHKTQAKFDKYMRENVLRERMKTIQKELGELDDETEVMDEYSTQLKKLKAPAVVKNKIDKEVRKLKQLSVNNPEGGYIRSWLDTIFELPWGKYSKGNFDLKKAHKILAKNHHGLPDVKDRILEFIAVLQLKQTNSDATTPTTKEKRSNLNKISHVPTILCFVGPPGVGKTSIGKSIAEALGRDFVKISLGGIRDEAEIRGHRRTYVGAMPGRIIAGLKQANSMNPVFMLDEVDKIGTDFRGDPSAALLEALDPEQNHAFEDHYLDLPFDLSQVLFITTANTLETIPPALRDRLEIIRYSGYTQEEKFHIAKQHLLAKTLDHNGLTVKQLKFNDSALDFIIGRYTREAGVRSLERNMSKIMRKAARQLLEANGQAPQTLTITPKKVREYLGPEKYDETLTEQTDQVGLATGLAWTSVGGDVLFIEVALTPGKGQVKLTGKLGDVMKESAQAALTYVKANATALGIDSETLNTTDVHIHVPEGAVPKDGPSAGITITSAIVSAFTKIPVKREVAMTGEITLRGRVLRIGGLKEKSIAAHRAGSSLVLIPADNERDLEEVPPSVLADVKFKPVASMGEVLNLALAKKPTRRASRKK